MTLFIDTTDFSRITFALAGGPAVKKRLYKLDPHESHKTLEKLEIFLKESKIPSSNIKKIVVNSGPGSYTGTRIGVTIGQALAFAWGLPVKFLSRDKFKIQ